MGQLGQADRLRDRLLNGADAEGRSARQQRRLELEAELRRSGLDDAGRLERQLELSGILLDLGELAEAFELGREALDAGLRLARWEDAALACRAMYLSEQPQAVAALGHGVWLAVACPVAPELSLQMLQDLVDEMPPTSDGAPVAAMLGYFLMEQRAAGSERERLVFLARQLVGQVAERHRGITDEEAIGIWVQMHELDDADVLLERMARMLDAIVPEWWFDREAVRARFPA